MTGVGPEPRLTSGAHSQRTLYLQPSQPGSWEGGNGLLVCVGIVEKQTLAVFAFAQCPLLHYLPQVRCGALSSTALAALLQALHIVTRERVVGTKTKHRAWAEGTYWTRLGNQLSRRARKPLLAGQGRRCGLNCLCNTP